MDEFHRENAGKSCFVLIFDFTGAGLGNAVSFCNIEIFF